MSFKTADLCDEFWEEVQVAAPLLHDFGGVTTFAGPMATVDAFEDNTVVREYLESAGEGRVLVVDGGGSLQRALLGDSLAALATENGWSGIVIHGCVRDVAELANARIGIRALAAVPLASHKRGRGSRGGPLHFAGITFRPNHYLYADGDGIITAPRDLLADND
ncbi:MAG TPA: ribonuclease E activity regulator RraA [Candidatus Sulfomarinibacteraceae bacterium]|nr:ribonuclease E activity regulator RraA [Candidatus Sulfomarinibacteraceae bacterium]